MLGAGDIKLRTALPQCQMRAFHRITDKPGAIIGSGLSLPHPIGIVIGQGAIIGGLSGAVLGAAVSSDDDRLKGAIIGGALGAGGGGPGADRPGTRVGADWRHGGGQGAAAKAARELGQQLKDYLPDAEVTGHSLGGGKAQAAGVVGGLKGSMFNAAGLHPKSVRLTPAELERHAGRFQQYRAEGADGGDPLTGLQNSREWQQRAYGGAQGLQALAQAVQQRRVQRLVLSPEASQ